MAIFQRQSRYLPAFAPLFYVDTNTNTDPNHTANPNPSPHMANHKPSRRKIEKKDIYLRLLLLCKYETLTLENSCYYSRTKWDKTHQRR